MPQIIDNIDKYFLSAEDEEWWSGSVESFLPGLCGRFGLGRGAPASFGEG